MLASLIPCDLHGNVGPASTALRRASWWDLLRTLVFCMPLSPVPGDGTASFCCQLFITTCLNLRKCFPKLFSLSSKWVCMYAFSPFDTFGEEVVEAPFPFSMSIVWGLSWTVWIGEVATISSALAWSATLNWQSFTKCMFFLSFCLTCHHSLSQWAVTMANHDSSALALQPNESFGFESSLIQVRGTWGEPCSFPEHYMNGPNDPLFSSEESQDPQFHCLHFSQHFESFIFYYNGSLQENHSQASLAPTSRPFHILSTNQSPRPKSHMPSVSHSLNPIFRSFSLHDQGNPSHSPLTPKLRDRTVAR